MKRISKKIIGILTLILILILSINIVKGQSSVTNSARFGIKGGVNLSNMFTKDVTDKNTIIGFNGGLFLKMPLSSNFAFQPELIYTTKGSELDYNSFVSGRARFSLSYFELPLLAVINLTENINIHGGVYVAALSNVSIKNKSDINLFNFESELTKSDFEKYDYGLVVGAGFDFDKIGLGVRYDYGLKSVGKDRSFLGQSYRFPDGRNSTLQLYLAISFL